VSEALSGRSIEITAPKAASLDRVAKPAGYRPVFLDRDCRIALRSEPFQEAFATRPWSPRLITSFVVLIPRDYHLPFLSFWCEEQDYSPKKAWLANEAYETGSGRG
jgi:hypothetical protein